MECGVCINIPKLIFSFIYPATIIPSGDIPGEQDYSSISYRQSTFCISSFCQTQICGDRVSLSVLTANAVCHRAVLVCRCT